MNVSKPIRSRRPRPLKSPPIVEAVVDIDCDVAPEKDIAALEREAKAAFGDHYPIAQPRFGVEQQISFATPSQMTLTAKQGIQALALISEDRRQLVQVRRNGFSFNRLAPYSSFDDYLPEIERTWSAFVGVVQPVIVRTVRMRYINQIRLPLIDIGASIHRYIPAAPKASEQGRFGVTGFFSQQSLVEPASGIQVNVALATQAAMDTHLPVILDIEAFKVLDREPDDWASISQTLGSLRDAKNAVFLKSLTPRCLKLFR